MSNCAAPRVTTPTRCDDKGLEDSASSLQQPSLFTSSAKGSIVTTDEILQSQTRSSGASIDAGGAPIDVIQQALLNFHPPQGWILSRIPPKSNNRSAIYGLGVRVQFENKVDSKPKMKWYCMVSSSCRENRTAISITAETTTPATDHLRARHGIGQNRKI
jgi:hypothetical protein